MSLSPPLFPENLMNMTALFFIAWSIAGSMESISKMAVDIEPFRDLNRKKMPQIEPHVIGPTNFSKHRSESLIPGF